MKAAVLAGGDLRPTPALRRDLQGAALVVAADSGLHHAAPLGLSPDLVVGDFDSVTESELARYPGLARLEHPRDKDALDLELALAYARRQGATEIVLAGGLGSRFDQSLAAVLIGAGLAAAGVDIRFDSGDRQLWFVTGPGRLAPGLVAGRRFSVLSLAPESVVSLEGARFPLRDHPLAFGVGLGVSNEVAAPPLRVELARGQVVVIAE